MQSNIKNFLEKIDSVISERENEKKNHIIHELSKQVIKEKRNMSKDFILVDGNKLKRSLFGKTLYVTKKIDGIFVLLYIYESRDEYKTVMFNSNGKVLERLSCQIDFDKCLNQNSNFVFENKLKVVCAELYMPGEKRTRVTDVLHALSCGEKEKLCLAPFYCYYIDTTFYDIFDFTAESCSDAKSDVPYAKIHSDFEEIFKNAEFIHPVMLETFTRKEDESDDEFLEKVQQVYDKWVKKEGAEGLVVRNEKNQIWKIKPQNTVDAIAIGYALDMDGSLRDLMFAVMDKDGKFHRFACGTSGLSLNEKKRYLAYFSDRTVESQNFIAVNSVRVPYQMVKPEKVFEISFVDLSAEKSGGEPCKNDLLVFDEKNGWKTLGLVNGVSTRGFAIVRERTDKNCVYEDIRLEQLSDIMPFSRELGQIDFASLPKSQVLKRCIYAKKTGKRFYIKKFVVFKTNKESTHLFPKYIVHFTDYSSGRKEPLKKDYFEASCELDAESIFNQQVQKHIKGEGWTYVSNV